MLVKKIQFCHCHFSRRSFGNLWFLGTLCMYIHDSKIFLKYMLDCILCLSSLAATIRWRCSHFVIFLWSKVLLQDQRVTVDFEAESASAGPDNIVFFYLPMFVWKHLQFIQRWTNPLCLKQPKAMSVLMTMFFHNAIESILFQDSS